MTRAAGSGQGRIGYELDMTLEAIKDLIEHLPPDEQVRLAGWISARDRQAWDAEIERDFSEGGAGLVLLEEVDALIDSGDSAGFDVSRPRGPADQSTTARQISHSEAGFRELRFQFFIPS